MRRASSADHSGGPGACSREICSPFRDLVGCRSGLRLCEPLSGVAVAELTTALRDMLDSKLVTTATNQMDSPSPTAAPRSPSRVRYAHAFNTLGGENIADPNFADGPAEMFFSAPDADRATVETVVTDVGLRPIYLGENRETSSTCSSSALDDAGPQTRARTSEPLTIS